jgi:solute carrier family 45 protein 1/2/4
LDQPPLPRIVRVANRRASHTRTVSSPNLLRTVLLSEAQPLLARRRSFEDQADDGQKSARVAGGTILGIHNLAIVFPQFLVSPFRSLPISVLTSSKIAIISSIIFKLADAQAHENPANTGAFYGKNGVAWVLRFGGLCTLVRRPLLSVLISCVLTLFWQFGAVLCRMVPPTQTEKEMRRRLGEMRVLKQEHTP